MMKFTRDYRPMTQFRPRFLLFLPLAAILALLGCAETEFLVHTGKEISGTLDKPKSQGRYKVGKPYQIKGVWYYPAEDYNYVETGIASWYGPNFHGKLTANGEIYDQNDITAAHRTLPMPSFVRVTNLENGRALVVRINDRGPYAHGRIIDLSKHSAKLLDVQRNGTARVRVQILEPESRQAKRVALNGGGTKSDGTVQVASATPAPKPPATPKETVSVQILTPIPGSTVSKQPTATVKLKPPPRQQSSVDLVAPKQNSGQVLQLAPERTRIFVQAGAFSSRDNAIKLAGKLAPAGEPKVMEAVVNGKTFYRVRFGPIDNVKLADQILGDVIRRGYPGARVVVD